MCGFCGFALSSGSPHRVEDLPLVEMREVLAHRGPDDLGRYTDGRVGLAHRRLSIVDLQGGRQPFSSDDGSVHLVYNGEVYNHLELRGSLEARGHRYRTRCDTETVLRLYQEEGARSVDRLRGMFAYAIWDSKRGELLLVRDRLGVKPLYYSLTPDGSIVFASEIKSILAAGIIRPELNVGVLPDYLANHAPSGAETLFQGVRRLQPGHTLTWRDGSVRIERYWDVAFEPRWDISDEDAIEHFASSFRRSVDMRLMADVPLGVFLSGGIDSSAIVAEMSDLTAERLSTFSVAFAQREANELGYAREVAAAFDTAHHEVTVSPGEFWAALPKLVWHEDEPLAHPSSVPLHFVAALAARDVKVVLTGEGSDELLAGYGRYWKTLYNVRLGRWYTRLLPEPIRGAVARALDIAPLPRRTRSRLERTFLKRPADLESLYLDNFAVFSRILQAQLLEGPAAGQLDGNGLYHTALAHLDRCDADELLDRLLYLDLKVYLHELLMKQDQMSMAASLESRVPFLDHELVEFVCRLPSHLKLRGWTTKVLLRRSLEHKLPPRILRRPKMGFPVPLRGWLAGPYYHLAHEIIAGERARSRGLFRREAVTRMLSQHRAGHADHSSRIWTLINLELWQRIFIDGDGRSHVTGDLVRRFGLEPAGAAPLTAQTG